MSLTLNYDNVLKPITLLLWSKRKKTRKSLVKSNDKPVIIFFCNKLVPVSFNYNCFNFTSQIAIWIKTGQTRKTNKHRVLNNNWCTRIWINTVLILFLYIQFHCNRTCLLGDTLDFLKSTFKIITIKNIIIFIIFYINVLIDRLLDWSFHVPVLTLWLMLRSVDIPEIANAHDLVLEKIYFRLHLTLT